MEAISMFIKNYSVYIVILLSITLCFIYFFKRKRELTNHIGILILLAILNTILGVLACKVMYFIEYFIGHDFLKIPDFHLESGFSFFGSVYFMPVYYIVLAKILKKDIKQILNIGMPAVLISSFCARLNCVIHGCCGGIVIGTTGWEAPTRLIELTCYLVIFIYILWKERKGTLKPGMALPIYYMIYGIVRIFEEPLRINFMKDSIHFGWLHSGIILIIGIFLYGIFYNNTKKSMIRDEMGEENEGRKNT